MRNVPITLLLILSGIACSQSGGSDWAVERGINSPVEGLGVGQTQRAIVQTNYLTTGNPSTLVFQGSNSPGACDTLVDYATEQAGVNYRCHRVVLTDGPFCGDSTCNGGETCGSCAQDCGACPVCGDGTCNGTENCSSCAQDCGACTANCFQFNVASNTNSAAGDNTMVVDGVNRSFRVNRYGSGANPALIFVLHYGSTNPNAAEYTINDFGLGPGNQGHPGNYYVVGLRTTGNGMPNGNWRINDPPTSNVDLRFFDDVLTCMQLLTNGGSTGIDTNRVSLAGYSSGAMFGAYLRMHRSTVFSAMNLASPGMLFQSNYVTPSANVPMMVGWGGTTDTVNASEAFDPAYASPPGSNTYSFHIAAQDFANRLIADGDNTFRCNYGGGHFTVGPVTSWWPQNWPFQFLYQHVRGQPSNWFDGSIPPNTIPASANCI